MALRPAESGDESFLRALHASTRQDLAVLPLPPGQLEALLDLQFRARETSYRQQFPGAEDSVIVVDGKPAGRLLLQRALGAPPRAHVVDIALLPAYRGQGIGTAVV
ncbi:MAG TPA: GNAT family N-acetyltransferase, partial [Actinomycetota bacterium]|nr:GNAT family N-acetyltransferase [Actinomycetota bacterium]